MTQLTQNAIYLLKTNKGEELLALCNLEDYFVDGDEVKLVQFFTQKNVDENDFHEFSKIDYALYYEDTKKLLPLTKKYNVEKYIGEFSEVVEHIVPTTENKPIGPKAQSNYSEEQKIRSFLEGMISPASNLL